MKDFVFLVMIPTRAVETEAELSQCKLSKESLAKDCDVCDGGGNSVRHINKVYIVYMKFHSVF